MKTTLITTILTAACIAASTLCQANAQSPTPSLSPSAVPGTKHEHRQLSPEKKLARMTKRLGLTEAQQGQILPILQTESQAITAAGQNTSLSDKQKRKDIREATKSANSQILAILTPEQQAKLKEHAHRKKDATAGTPASSPATTPTAQ